MSADPAKRRACWRSPSLAVITYRAYLFPLTKLTSHRLPSQSITYQASLSSKLIKQSTFWYPKSSIKQLSSWYPKASIKQLSS